MADKLTKNDLTLIQRCVQSPVTYTFAPCPRGGTHAKLVRSAASPSLRKHLRRLALGGYIAESTTDSIEPPEHTFVYSVTALGREAVGEYRTVKPLVNVDRTPSDTELLAEAQDA